MHFNFHNSLVLLVRSNNAAFLTKMYCTYVRSTLESSCWIFSPHTKKGIDKIEKIQHRATRMIFIRCYKTSFINMPTYEERLKTLKLKSLELRRTIFDLILFYKLINKHIKIKLKSEFKWVPNRLRGSRYKLQIPICKDPIRANSFLHKTAALFVKLPPDCQNSSTVNIFKKNLAKINLMDLIRP
jgi:hypothetical protein